MRSYAFYKRTAPEPKYQSSIAQESCVAKGYWCRWRTVIISLPKQLYALLKCTLCVAVVFRDGVYWSKVGVAHALDALRRLELLSYADDQHTATYMRTT